MSINKIFLACIFITITHIAFAQSTFSKLYPLEPFPASIFNAVLATDSAYFITGIVADSVFPYGTKPLFVRTDIEGNVEIVRVYKDEDNDYETWNQGLYFDNDNKIVTNGYIFNNTPSKQLFIIRYTQEGTVDTLIDFSHANDYGDIPYPMLQNQKKEFIIPVQSSPNNRGTNVLFFLSNSGDFIDEKIYNPQNGNMFLIRLDTTKHGFILGGWQAPAGPVLNGIHQTIIVEFDSIGNKIWEYASPIDEDWCGTLGGIVSNDDGEVIYVSGQGYIFDPNSVSDYFNNKWYATKLDRQKNIVWRTLIPSIIDNTIEGNRFWNILKLKDNKNYVSMGMLSDSVTGIYVWIVKFSDEGEIIWNRNYKMESDTNGYQHEIRDMVEDSEGNLIAVGERLDLVRQGFNLQQALLMKLDKYGCLTPGCHLVSTKEEYEKDFNVKIYPNPATDFISFYIGKHLFSHIDEYLITDISGKVIKGIQSIKNDIHYIIHTNDFLSGFYFINFLKNGQIVKTEKFIISH